MAVKKMVSLCAIAAVALLATVFAAAPASASWMRDEPWEHVKCRPLAENSPSTEDALRVVQWLRTESPDKCCQDTMRPGGCHTLYTHKTASAVLCGPFRECVDCKSQAGEYTNIILSQCVQNDENGVRRTEGDLEYKGWLYRLAPSDRRGLNGQNDAECSYPEGSPSIEDAKSAVDHIRTLQNGKCCQTAQNSDNGCTILHEAGDAAVSMCGKFDECHSCQGTVGQALDIILSQCVKLENGRRIVGGKLNYQNEGMIYEIHPVGSCQSQNDRIKQVVP